MGSTCFYLFWHLDVFGKQNAKKQALQQQHYQLQQQQQQVENAANNNKLKKHQQPPQIPQSQPQMPPNGYDYGSYEITV